MPTKNNNVYSNLKNLNKRIKEVDIKQKNLNIDSNDFNENISAILDEIDTIHESFYTQRDNLGELILVYSSNRANFMSIKEVSNFYIREIIKELNDMYTQWFIDNIVCKNLNTENRINNNKNLNTKIEYLLNMITELFLSDILEEIKEKVKALPYIYFENKKGLNRLYEFSS